MPFRITTLTNFRPTLPADTLLFAFDSHNMLRPNPLPTLLRRAINPILRGIFIILSLPLLPPLI